MVTNYSSVEIWIRVVVYVAFFQYDIKDNNAGF